MAEATLTDCKIDHGAEGAIPAWLCRGCHPERNLTTEEKKTAEAADRKRARDEAKLAAKRREVDNLARKLAAPGMVNARKGSVNYKIKMSHEKKLAKLRRKAA